MGEILHRCWKREGRALSRSQNLLENSRNCSLDMSSLNEEHMSPQLPQEQGVKARWLQVAAQWQPQGLRITDTRDTGRLRGSLSKTHLLYSSVWEESRCWGPHDGKPIGFPGNVSRQQQGGCAGHGSQGASRATQRGHFTHCAKQTEQRKSAAQKWDLSLLSSFLLLGDKYICTLANLNDN